MWRRISTQTLHRVRRHSISPAASLFQCNLFSTTEPRIRINDPPTREEIIAATEAQQQHFAEMKKEVKNRTGRAWSDPWDIEEIMDSRVEYDDLPEWSPEHVSRVSQERIRVRPLMTLEEMAELELPPPPPPNPGKGETKAYALYRKRLQYKYVQEQVAQMAKPRLAAIQALTDWEEKQDAVDLLFEEIEFELKEKEEVLGKHPKFGSWVERALEEFLQRVRKGEIDIGLTSVSMETLENLEGAEALGTIDTNNVETADAAEADANSLEMENLETVNLEAENMETVKLEMEAVVSSDATSGALNDSEIEALVAPSEATSNLTIENAETLEEEDAAKIGFEAETAEMSEDDDATESDDNADDLEMGEEEGTLMLDNDAVTPWFMDCFDADKDTENEVVPSILHPLQPKQRENMGRMIEEWELSAHKTTKRIMIRHCMQELAQTIASSDQVRVLVHGDKGIGKTAALASIVAAARKSGYIVLYLPDGDRLHKLGYYVESNRKLPGLFDIPMLSSEVCKQLLTTHKDDLDGFVVSSEMLENHFNKDLFGKLPEYPEEGMPIPQLLALGAEKVRYGPMSFYMTVEILKKQDQKPFLMVLDEFNCFFDRGHYFHRANDKTGRKPIPYNQITLFKPVLEAMGLFASPDQDDVADASALLIKRGGVIAATSESRVVPRQVTDALIANAKLQSSAETAPIHVQYIPRLSALEIEHMLSHYEATGIGKLRMDSGATVMNQQEVAFLRMVSGGIPQRLMNACMM